MIDLNEISGSRLMDVTRGIARWTRLSGTGDVLAARGLTRFVGRHAELETVRDAFRAVETTGTGQVIALVGEPGVGKSGLVWEVVREQRQRQPESLVLDGACVSYGETAAYQPVVELLRRNPRC